MIINIRSIPAPDLSHGASMNTLGSNVIFAEDSACDADAGGISQERRSVSRTLSGRVTGKDREVDGYEMVSAPGRLRVLDDV
jgi:hypothetical protein